MVIRSEGGSRMCSATTVYTMVFFGTDLARTGLAWTMPLVSSSRPYPHLHLPSCSVSAARGALHSNCAGFHLGVRLAHPCPRVRQNTERGLRTSPNW